MALSPEDQKSYLLRDLMHKRETRVRSGNARTSDNDRLPVGEDTLSLETLYKAAGFYTELMAQRDKGDE
jgi:hypothetical protein